ncbi:3-deoxy-7-phosphoheptulonate synthase class II [Sorangium sp. KYC3313]|uniref:3-deoxy-7-phosphoheptulonate synthase class II n=1 Tax=Sorangium sp. KYC3313 TaxID=3449740 RepID=UPI003F896427
MYVPAQPWSPDSWRERFNAAPLPYDDPDAVQVAVEKLRALPPLVTSWEVERLKGYLAEAQVGRRFVLQGGDCAETLDDCRPNIVTNKLKILLQMSLVLVHGARRPVVRLGRFAGQYAKPRSSPVETRDGVSLPSYFGDLINRAPFDASARRPDPNLMIAGYQHAAITLNFIRSLSEGGFADLHHPEYWDLSFLERADLPGELRERYQRMTEQVGEALRFMEALAEVPVGELSRVEFFTSHEGLHLHYESAQTRKVARRPGFYDLTTHLPWIGERTRQPDGAHVEFFSGVENPLGIKLGPKTLRDDVIRLLDRLNPTDEPGKIVLIVRMGAGRVRDGLPPLIEAVRSAGRKVLWMSDPMHGNTQTTSSGIKTRNFEDILTEIEASFEVHESMGSHLGGVHFELTGDDVTECVGAGLTESDLDQRYASLCDPRLNYRQSLEMAFRIAHRMAEASRRARG